MVRIIAGIAVVLYCAIGVFAETVSLKGTVRSAGGAGIAGVKVSLTKLSTMSSITTADGAFTIQSSSVLTNTPQTLSIQFILTNNAIVFSPTPQALSGSVALFSSNGKLIASFRFHGLTAGKQRVAIPEFHSGITVIRLTINDKTFTRTVICLGNNLFLKQENQVENSGGNFTIAKQLAAVMVDTLKAEKTGYVAKKLGIDSYTKQNILITFDSSNITPGACTRDALQAMVDKYVEAQKAGDPSKMPLASDVMYTQNMKAITADKSIVKTALPTIASERTILDVDSCRTFTELIVTAGSHPYVIGTRLKVDNDKISEVNTMVTDKGDWQFDADKYLSNSKDEKWEIQPADKRTGRQALINAGNAYFDLIFDWTKDTVPWGDPCYRIEGGSMVANPCTGGTTGNSVKTTCRTYVVDTAVGAINLYCYFGYGPDSHLFRMENKKVIYIHTMTACGDTVAAGQNCWGTAAKGKGKAFCDKY